MAFIVWEDKYSIGNSEIDEQHKKLLELINILDACINLPDVSKLSLYKDTLDKLVDYINFHFSSEEKYMREINYPEYEFHRKAHYTFVKKVMQSVKYDFSEKDKDIEIKYRELLVFLKNWLVMHILIVDKKIG